LSGLKKDDILEISTAKDLEGFKKALYEDHQEILRTLQEDMEQEISDKLSSTRIAVERSVGDLRTQQQDTYRSMKERENLLLEQKKREFLNHLVIDQYSKIQEQVFQKLDQLRRRPELYKPILNDLIREALASFSTNPLIMVEKDDLDLIDEDLISNPVKSAEIATRGGCLVLDHQDNRIVIDNTMVSRMGRIKDSLLLRIAERINEIVRHTEIQSR